jgi:hypothetical protein
MDFGTIAVMASSILAPYLAKGGEAFASEFGKSSSQKIGDLSHLIKNKFKGDKEAETVLELVEKNPQSKARVAALGEEINEKMVKDPDFARKLSALMEQVHETDSWKVAIKASNRSVAALNISGSAINTGGCTSSNSKDD